ncbi:hypothetical protein [Clostridium estertheticum]|uniref:hypothetical protein n=1 Tax=Clostridium estertheticum TaxID=238834 RepID=UPI001C7DE420|nr:hypothetical protein [Clostridium estertheticum]MBX4264498.1 hypothetical protein [Clostridium estertheticum]WLC88646.1 hypothetical protein KTC95_22100 [Clostridium estertheticum]
MDDLKKLNGKKVSIEGFMEDDDQDDKANTYIASTTYPQTHKSFRDILDSIISITEADNKEFVKLDGPVIATGYMQIENVSLNLRGEKETYKYKMVGVTVRRLTASEVDENMRTYTKLTDVGFITDFNKALALSSFLEDIKLNPTTKRMSPLVEKMNKELDLVGRKNCKNLVVMLDRLKLEGIELDSNVANGKKVNEDWWMKENNAVLNEYKTWINSKIMK